MKLTQLHSYNVCRIKKIVIDPRLKRRLYELGFIPNTIIELINVSPMKKAYLIRIHNSIFAIREEIAKKIEVVNI